MDNISAENFKQKLQAETFTINNGKILRTLVILQTQFNALDGVARVLHNDGMDMGDFLESLDFLHEEQYIRLRRIETKEVVESVNLREYKQLEAKITAKGKRLLHGGITDNMVEV